MSEFLVGKTINEILIADDKMALLFKCADGDHLVKVDADCCSDSWIESIEKPALGFPCNVLNVENLELSDGEENEDFEVTSFYGCKITTDKGDLVIDYRNSSNGYYGGNLSWPDDKYFYGGVYGQNISTEKWVDVEYI